jgi:hypothetical protein
VDGFAERNIWNIGLADNGISGLLIEGSFRLDVGRSDHLARPRRSAVLRAWLGWEDSNSGIRAQAMYLRCRDNSRQLGHWLVVLFFARRFAAGGVLAKEEFLCHV